MSQKFFENVGKGIIRQLELYPGSSQQLNVLVRTCLEAGDGGWGGIVKDMDRSFEW